jgi:hypothetical protein
MNEPSLRQPSLAIDDRARARRLAGALALAAALTLCACHPRGPAVATTPTPQGADATGRAAEPAFTLRSDVDLDGDGVHDELLARFTGGGHCCYRVGARFAGAAQVLWLPFDLDGGYGRGDGLGSDPSRFDIVEQDSGPTEVVMEIEMYNGEPQPLPSEWRQTYGVASHHVLVTFAGRRTNLRNLPDVVPPDPPAE